VECAVNRCDAYYDVLERTQRGSLDVTAWLAWFLDALGRASITLTRRSMRF
jgi:Fic family protein